MAVEVVLASKQVLFRPMLTLPSLVNTVHMQAVYAVCAQPQCLHGTLLVGRLPPIPPLFLNSQLSSRSSRHLF
jgi:hypothetical protein